MRQIVMALALGLSLAGCASSPAPLSHDSGPNGAMMHMAADLNDDPGPCRISVWMTGVIVPDANGHAGIRDETGRVWSLMWGSRNKGYVDWGGRYRIGGNWFSGNYFWACGGVAAVIPQ